MGNVLINNLHGKTSEEQYNFINWLLNDYGSRFTDTRQAVIDWLDSITEDMPTIKSEHKKGRWIPQDNNEHFGMTSTCVYYFPKCSNCGFSANYTNFCPNCGADMREGGEDEN